MKLIYYSVAITLFCVASFAAPAARAERQTNVDHESELKTGLRILRHTMCPTKWQEKKIIPVVAALCEVMNASRNNKVLESPKKQAINNHTCDLFQRLNVSTISNCTDRELIKLQCSRAIVCTHMVERNTSVDGYLDDGDECVDCWLTSYLSSIDDANIDRYVCRKLYNAGQTSRSCD